MASTSKASSSSYVDEKVLPAEVGVNTINDGSSNTGRSFSEATLTQDATATPKTTGFRLVFTMIGLYLAVFCVALDMTIIATAVPRITDQFHALQDVGWYGSAYLLTMCAFQLFFGKLYFIFGTKVVFLSAISLFELGSLIAGVAPSSVALIWGRVIAGIGSAGIFSGALIIIAKITALEKRAAYLGSLAGTYGIASVIGPLLGGAFTDKATWRWCFYINLPIGAITVAAVTVALRLPDESIYKTLGFKKVFWQLDPIGTVLFIASIACILLALQWGGTTYAWNSGPVVALLVVFAVTLVAFVVVQAKVKDNATVPARVGLQRSIAFGSFYVFFLGGGLFLLMYFLPIWFQAVKGTDALTSGIDTIPLILSQTVGIFFSSGMVTRFGWYMPYVYICVTLTSIASGLLTTLNVDTSVGRWVGYQILYGFGCGCGWQQPQIAAQVVLPSQDIPIGVAVTLFATMFGGSVFVSVGDSVLNNALVKGFAALDIPGVDPKMIAQIGATELKSFVPAAYLARAVEVYNEAVVDTFEVVMIISCVSLLGAAGMQWRSPKHGAERAAASSA